MCLRQQRSTQVHQSQYSTSCYLFHERIPKMKARLSLSLLLVLLCAFVSIAQKLEPILQLGHTNDITAAAFASDGKVLISSSKDNVLKLWNTVTGGLLQTLEDAAFVLVSP